MFSFKAKIIQTLDNFNILFLIVSDFLSLISLIDFSMDINLIWVILISWIDLWAFFSHLYFLQIFISIPHLIWSNFKTSQEHTLIRRVFVPY